MKQAVSIQYNDPLIWETKSREAFLVPMYGRTIIPQIGQHMAVRILL